MHLDVITPEKTIYSGEIEELAINTANGEIAILPHHVNLFTRIMPGEMIFKVNKKDQYLAVTGGFLEISDNVITVLADYAVKADEIEVDKAIAAQKRAEEIIRRKKEGVSEKDFATAQADLRRALLELHVANRRRRKTVQ